jgi:pyrroloquinoline quinone biosynthesis protein D
MQYRNQGDETVNDAAFVTTLDARPRVSSQFRLQWEEVQQSWVLLYPEGMVKLNRSAGEIMRRSDGIATVQEIVADLERSFGAEGLTKDVLGFIELAKKQRWIEV